MAPPSPGLQPELKDPRLHSSVGLLGESVNPCCLPGFHQHSVFTPPVTKSFYLRHATLFRVSKLYRLLQSGSRPLLSGEGEGCRRGSAPCWDPASRTVARSLFLVSELTILAVRTYTTSSQEKERGLSEALPLVGPLLGEQLLH